MHMFQFNMAVVVTRFCQKYGDGSKLVLGRRVICSVRFGYRILGYQILGRIFRISDPADIG